MLPASDSLTRTVSKQMPACRAVTCASVVCRIDERLHQNRSIAPPRLPVHLHPPSELTKNMAHQMRYANPRKQQQALVIDDPGEVSEALLTRPTYPLISYCQRHGCAPHQKTTQPTTFRANKVAQGAADCPFASQRVIATNVLAPQRGSFVAADDLEPNRLQLRKLAADGLLLCGTFRGDH